MKCRRRLQQQNSFSHQQLNAYFKPQWLLSQKGIKWFPVTQNIIFPEYCTLWLTALKDFMWVAHRRTKTAITPDWANYSLISVKASCSCVLTEPANQQTQGRTHNSTKPTTTHYARNRLYNTTTLS